MIQLKRPEELDAMRRAGRVVSETLMIVRDSVKPGMTTADLDAIGEREIRARGAIPSFLGYRGFPATLCTSLNSEIVHGIPGGQVINEGDLLKIDCGAIVDGFHGDSAITVLVGDVTPEARKLSEVTKQALDAAIEQCLPGNRLGDIGSTVQAIAESNGYSVLREYVGHGIGRALHEDPPVPNHGRAGKGVKIQPGLVIAIEPMVNMGSHDTRVLDDDWTVVTADGSLSSHWEHTIAITEDGFEVLTARSDGS